jgi:AcrR family transcriptional regulator
MPVPEHASGAHLTVSDLADRSGLPASTIRYYAREGLIPAGRRLSRTRVLYDGDHLAALEKIKSLREAGVPLTEIRSRVSHAGHAPSDCAIAEARRNDVLEAATSCFLSAGFARTSLGAIARSASMSKATLYRYFSSKEEIFMACAERVFHQIYIDVWPAITQTRNPGERLRARWDAFVESFAEWAPMMDLVRGLAIGDPAFREGCLCLTSTIVAPIARELSRLDADQRPDVDFELLSYVVMGMAEAGARAVSEGRHDAESAWGYLEPVLAEQTRRAYLLRASLGE